MSSLVYTLDHAGLVLSGAVVCFLFLQWRKQKGIQEEAADARSLLDQARREAEIILRDARLAASEEALRIHAEAEKALADRRAERLELERRLTERETLINSQMGRIVQAEKNLDQEKETLSKKARALACQEEDVAELLKQVAQIIGHIVVKQNLHSEAGAICCAVRTSISPRWSS